MLTVSSSSMSVDAANPVRLLSCKQSRPANHHSCRKARNLPCGAVADPSTAVSKQTALLCSQPERCSLGDTNPGCSSTLHLPAAAIESTQQQSLPRKQAESDLLEQNSLASWLIGLPLACSCSPPSFMQLISIFFLPDWPVSCMQLLPTFFLPAADPHLLLACSCSPPSSCMQLNPTFLLHAAGAHLHPSQLRPRHEHAQQRSLLRAAPTQSAGAATHAQPCCECSSALSSRPLTSSVTKTLLLSSRWHACLEQQLTCCFTSGMGHGPGDMGSSASQAVSVPSIVLQ